MEIIKNKSLSYYMRLWHGQIGFFIVGMVIIYSLSGLVLIYRDTDFLKREVIKEKQLAPQMAASELGGALRIREFKAEKTEENIIYFETGSYDINSGLAVYTTKELPGWIDKLTHLHKSNSGDLAHYFTTVFGFLLFFMAISSFWMFKPGTKIFRKGLYIAGSGIVATLIILFL